MVHKWREWLNHRTANALVSLKDQKGAQAIEYVAVCALVVLLLTGIMSAFEGEGGKEIGTAVLEKIKGWFTQWGNKS
ncbi:hypothetical protein LOK74_22865 [Brevibacillus humidisoli]|uniref:Flp family type IVb pilin n=1 Tax=Brevibacillus humidisoli TaxID=2895522 RepID=UPI001E3DB9BE|nr:hypothetical protein [Brevibacillus humidisoli]UFJ40799.1 hypothetical protein LOK74_22865 [Brevibacillus humidisoli]